MYGEPLYKLQEIYALTAEKNISVSFRVCPKFKALLAVAAARENRSLTNMLETLLFDYCEKNGFLERLPSTNGSSSKATKK